MGGQVTHKGDAGSLTQTYHCFITFGICRAFSIPNFVSKLILNYSGTHEHKYTSRKDINTLQFKHKKLYVISTCWKRFGTVRHCRVLHLYSLKNCQRQGHLVTYFVTSPEFFYSILTSGLTPTKQDGLYRLSQGYPARNKSPVIYSRKLRGYALWSGFKAPCEHTDVLRERLKPFSSESNYAPLPRSPTQLCSERTDHSLPSAPFFAQQDLSA